MQSSLLPGAVAAPHHLKQPAQQLTLDGISHSYGSALAVNNVTIEVKGGELIALLGPSGCGKTTLLRIVAGFRA